MKTQSTLAAIALLAALTGAARAECYADYKAKKAPPLQLHYGVLALAGPECANPRAAKRAIQARIAQDGWTLLNVLSIFGPEGLAERRGSAGDYFLRY